MANSNNTNSSGYSNRENKNKFNLKIFLRHSKFKKIKNIGLFPFIVYFLLTSCFFLFAYFEYLEKSEKYKLIIFM